MSYADQVFMQNIQEILDHGVWDTDQNVRPHWEDGTPAHTIKKFGIVNRYDLQKEFPILTLRRTTGKQLWTSCCGSGRKSPTTSMTSTPGSGISGRTRPAPLARPRLPAGREHHYPEGDMDQWTGCSTI